MFLHERHPSQIRAPHRGTCSEQFPDQSVQGSVLGLYCSKNSRLTFSRNEQNDATPSRVRSTSQTEVRTSLSPKRFRLGVRILKGRIKLKNTAAHRRHRGGCCKVTSPAASEDGRTTLTDRASLERDSGTKMGIWRRFRAFAAVAM